MKDNTNHSIGAMGEKKVARYLALRFYRIVAMNYRIKGGEIDIIAKRGNITAFVEVKTRNEKYTESYGRPALAVDEEKIKHLKYTAKRYLSQNPDIKNIRFDVAEVYSGNGKTKIIYMKDAFR